MTAGEPTSSFFRTLRLGGKDPFGRSGLVDLPPLAWIGNTTAWITPDCIWRVSVRSHCTPAPPHFNRLSARVTPVGTRTKIIAKKARSVLDTGPDFGYILFGGKQFSPGHPIAEEAGIRNVDLGGPGDCGWPPQSQMGSPPRGQGRQPRDDAANPIPLCCLVARLFDVWTFSLDTRRAAPRRGRFATAGFARPARQGSDVFLRAHFQPPAANRRVEVSARSRRAEVKKVLGMGLSNCCLSPLRGGVS